MRASVIVPAHNAQATLPRTLEALSRQQLDGEHEVIVVDDGSSDGTAAIVRAAGAPVRLISQPAAGPAAARNLGVSHARGEALAFCDADVFPASGWLRAGVGALARSDLVQGKVLPDPLAALGPFDRTLWITFDAGLWEAANLFVSRRLFEAVGGFEDWLWPPGGKPLGEDVLFGYRAQRLGARSAFCEHALAHHAVFPRDWRGYVAERRRLRFFPAIARETPELRRSFMYGGLFLNRRSAQLDLALAGALLALVSRSRLPFAAAAPYLRAWRASSRRGAATGVSAWCVGGADLAADLVGFASLLEGSVRFRSLLL